MSSLTQNNPQTIETTRFSWFAIQTHTKASRQVSSVLQLKDVETFLPVYRLKRRWHDRIHESERQLFPGYVFARFDVLLRLPILTTPGVQRIVGSSQGPIPIADEEIESMRTAVQAGFDLHSCAFMRVGQRVRIEKGPLAGLTGILLQKRKYCRIVLSVSLLQRSVSVELDAEWVTLDSSKYSPSMPRSILRQPSNIGVFGCFEPLSISE